jgi:cell division control protein 6
MALDYFEDLLKKPPIFKDESKLDINFVPERLPNREKELSLLSQLFLALITNPNSVSRKILIIGRTGIGKTATVKLFGEMLTNAAKRRDIFIKYIHINCRKERTSYKVVIKIIRVLNQNFPKRGYSPQDLLDIIIDHISDRNIHLLIVLDELSYLINKGDDLIYSLTRINDDSITNKQRVSIIGIAREISCLNNLDISTMSTLQRNIVKFRKYSKEQLFEILKYRINLSLKENTISEENIELLSNLVYENGDMRYGLNLLWRAGKIAENQSLKYITSECIRLSNQDVVPFSTQDILKYMGQHKLIYLLSIIKSLKSYNRAQISIGEIANNYKVLGENLGIKIRSYSQIWNYLKDFQKENLISLNIICEAIKGRKAFVSIGDISLAKFESIVIKILQSKGIIL